MDEIPTSAHRPIRFMSAFSINESMWCAGPNGTAPHVAMPLLIEQARIAERGLFEALFMADFYAYLPTVKIDPLTICAALAAATRRIGFVASVSTTYEDPTEIARMVAMLHRLSGGRVGWNMVTTANGAVAANFGDTDHMEHDTRYARAHEVLSEITRLWAGERSEAVDPVPPCFPVRPVLSQAGSSEMGKRFAARWADLIFTAQPDLEIGREFYADVKARVVRNGRSPDAMWIMPGMHPIIVENGKVAEAITWGSPAISASARADQLEKMLGIPLLSLPQDEQVPLELIPEASTFNGIRSRAELYYAVIRKHRFTPAQVLRFNPHLTMTGTPEQIADEIDLWVSTRACDGFVLLANSLDQRKAFVELVIPILQQRGRYPLGYPDEPWSARLGAEADFSISQAVTL